jgi:hypothetical protein
VVDYRIRTRIKTGRLVEWGEYAVPRRVTLTMDSTDETPGAADPDFSADFEVRDGNAECVSISLTAHPDGRGIRTSDLGLFNVENLTQTVFVQSAYKVLDPGHAYAKTSDSGAMSGASRTVGRHVGRESGALLKEVARMYLADKSGAGIMAVAARLGVSRSTAARRIDHARDQGYIPRPGASETEKAEALARLQESTDPEPNSHAMSLNEAAAWAETRRDRRKNG